MKKIFTLALLAILGVGSAFAGDVTFVPSDFTPTDTKDYSLTKDGVTVEVKASTVNADQIRIYKGKTITISSTVGNITQAVFTCTAEGTAKYGPGCFEDATAGSYSYDAAVGTWTGDASEFTLTAKSNQVRATQIVVTIAEGGQVQTKTATSIAFGDDGYETRATCGKDEQVGLPSYQVLKDGTTDAIDATVTWSLEKTSGNDELDGAAINGNFVTIPNGAWGVLKVTASYAGDATYKACTKSYDLTVYKGAGLLSEMVKDVTDTNDKWDNGGELVSYWLVDIDNNMTSAPNIVTYVNGKSIYLTDGTNNLLFYGDNTQDLKKGDKISGNLGSGKMGAVWGTLYRYNKLPEFKFTEMNVKVESEGAAVEPATITIDKLAENVNAYVKIENAEFVEAGTGKNLKFKVGDTDLAIYNQWSVDVAALEAGAKYTLVGMGSVYKETYQLYLISFEKTGETGISSVKTAAEFNGAIYNIAGQKVSASYKGLVIKNGKKIVQK